MFKLNELPQDIQDSIKQMYQDETEKTWDAEQAKEVIRAHLESFVETMEVEDTEEVPDEMEEMFWEGESMDDDIIDDESIEEETEEIELLSPEEIEKYWDDILLIIKGIRKK